VSDSQETCRPGGAGKRLFDLAGATLGLILMLPVGLLICLCIKLADGGPVFYRQVRLGRFGRPFHIWKFRSMVVQADRLGFPLTRGGDPRITRLGRILRQTKLDELPQLWNVLAGEMSLVGPRPEVPEYVERYTPEQRQVLNCKPGITDLASVLFRNEEALLRGAADVQEFYIRYCLPKKIELNRQYMARAGVLQDLWIILRTLWGVVPDSFLAGWRGGSQPRSAARSGPEPPARRVAIIGTGAVARRLALELRRHPQDARRVVAFFDDDPRAWHKRPCGIPVAGMPECLLNTQWRQGIDEIIVALPEVEAARRRQIGELLRSLPAKSSSVAAASDSPPVEPAQAGLSL
jgi:lipopolysaccharide/colanic/teichoic acid biosynthesis glycosyltransferase